MPINLYETVSSYVLQALLAEKRRKTSELLMAGDAAGWGTLTVAQQDRRLEEADRLSGECEEITSALLSRLPDDDAPPSKRYVQNYVPIGVAPLTIDDPNIAALMSGGPQLRTGNAKMMQFAAATQLAYGQGARTNSFADQPGIGAVRMLKSYAACHGNMAMVAQPGSTDVRR